MHSDDLLHKLIVFSHLDSSPNVLWMLSNTTAVRELASQMLDDRPLVSRAMGNYL